MSFPQYERYKDSGVEWLGKVPEHWDILPLKRLAVLITGITPPTEDQNSYSDGDGFPWLTPDDLQESGANIVASKHLSPQGKGLIRVVPPESTLICCIGSIGKVGCVRSECSTNQQITAAAFKLSHRYSFYLLAAAKEDLMRRSVGNVIRLINTNKLGELPLAVPDATEAQCIAAFLDNETAKIDALIEEQRRLIELLKEKRQAVITHAVTKGLNPEVRTENSGSDWLGLIPQHWNSGVLVRCASRIVVGIAEAATHAYADEGVPILRSTNIRAGKIIGDILRILPELAADRGSKLINSNDLITVRTGNAGVTAVVPPEFDGCQCFTMLITSLMDQAVPEFYCYYMNSVIATAYFGVEGWGTAQVNISVPILKALPIPIPPKHEQQLIVKYLDMVVGRIDELTSEADKGVSLLLVP